LGQARQLADALILNLGKYRRELPAVFLPDGIIISQ
jgi:hypothetical protein